MNTRDLPSPAVAPTSTTQASSQSLHSHNLLLTHPVHSLGPRPAPPLAPAHNSVQRRGEEEGGRTEEERNGEVALSGGRLGVRLAGRGTQSDDLNPLSLSVSLSLSSLPSPLSPNVGFLSPCLTAVCQTIPLSPLWGTGWMPSRWAATVTTLSTQDLPPLTWWPRWQQSEWSYSGLQRLSGTEFQSQIKNTSIWWWDAENRPLNQLRYHRIRKRIHLYLFSTRYVHILWYMQNTSLIIEDVRDDKVIILVDQKLLAQKLILCRPF